MAFRINAFASKGLTLRGVIRKLVAGAEGDWWSHTSNQWKSSVSAGEELITLTDSSGQYTGATSQDLAGYTGYVRLKIWDQSGSQWLTAADVQTLSGIEVNGHDVTAGKLNELLLRDVSALMGLERGVAQTVLVFIIDQDGFTPVGAMGVTSTQVAPVTPSPAYLPATNPALYSGVPGYYTVALTALETDHESRLVKVTLADGSVGEALITFGRRSIETDWANGGRLDLLLDSVISKLDVVDGIVDDVLVDTSAVDATLKLGGAMYTKLFALDTSTLATAANLATLTTSVTTIGTNVSSALTKVTAIETTLTNGGAIHELIEGIDAGIGGGDATLANQTSMLSSLAALTSSVTTIGSNTAATNTTLQPGGAIHTAIGNIAPGVSSPISAREVAAARTWRVDREGVLARNVVQLTAQDAVTLAMDFADVLNNDTTLQAAVSATAVLGVLATSNVAIAQDRTTVHFTVTNPSAGVNYRMRCVATTTDGQTISGEGVLKVL